MPVSQAVYFTADLVERLIDEADRAIPAADERIGVPRLRVEHTAHGPNSLAKFFQAVAR